MHSALISGSMPGIAASTRETWLLGSPPKAVEAPENSFDLDATWACTSSPTMTSQSPLEPEIRFFDASLLALSCMGKLLARPVNAGARPEQPQAWGSLSRWDSGS